MSDPARISHQELLPLPHWLRLGLALRCLRRARGFVKARPEQLQVIDHGLERLDRAARAGRAGDDLADAAAAAYTLALDNLDTGKDSSGDEDTVVLTCMLAHALAFTAEAATLTDSWASAHLVGQGIDFAMHSCRLVHGMIGQAGVGAMRADLLRFRAVASQGAWDDQTPVPEDLLTAPEGE